ncbi:MAG TPA: long-chain fatty acid--CoA ligase, partial [Streptosporangiaceae bacterium]
RALARGATLVTLPRFDVPGFLAAIQDHRITQTVVVPPIVLALASIPRWTSTTCPPLSGSAAGPRR